MALKCYGREFFKKTSGVLSAVMCIEDVTGYYGKTYKQKRRSS